MQHGKTRSGEAVRMHEVAARAGVSAMTVSRALRTPDAVSKAMFDRVQAAIHDTGYVANRLAGSLASRRSDVVGLIVPGIRNSLYASMADAIEGELRARGFHLMIGRCGHDPGEEEAAIGAFLAQRVCGLILHSTLHTARAKAMIAGADIPTVEIGRVTRAPLDMCVSYSGHAAAKSMVLHLGQLGYRRIGFVSLPLRNNDRAAERRRGYFAGLKALGVTPDPALALETAPGFGGGADAVVRLVALSPAIEAVFFAADVMAVGALFECQRRGWTVPGRLAIASFDNVELLEHVVPTITTLCIPREEIGRRSAAMLLARLDGQMSGPAIVDLGFSIAQRASTSRPG